MQIRWSRERPGDTAELPEAGRAMRHDSQHDPEQVDEGELLDAPAIRATIDRALRPLPMPTRAELVELERQLCSHVELLLPLAQATVDTLWCGSVEWYQRRERLDRVAGHAGQGPGDTALSAHVQVRHLARDCAALLTYVEGDR